MPEHPCHEAVAYDLMRDIMFDDPCRPSPTSAEFRGYALDLYAECLATVTGKRDVTDAGPGRIHRPPPIVESDIAAARPIEAGRKRRLQPAQG